ncbi:MAG: DUF531 family protein [Thermoplasmatota archaeon]
MPGRLTLGLYNSYDPQRWQEAMRRALVRAAPVALAFDCNLATFGFPYDEGRRRESKDDEAPDLRTPQEIAAFVAGSTSVAGAHHFQELADAGRFNVFDYPGGKHGSPGGFPPQLGRALATTEVPKPKGALVTPLDCAHELARGKSQLLVIGLGPRGLPPKLVAATPDHLELTGRGIGFETATAMAAMPALVHAHLHHLNASPGPKGARR